MDGQEVLGAPSGHRSPCDGSVGRYEGDPCHTDHPTVDKPREPRPACRQRLAMVVSQKAQHPVLTAKVRHFLQMLRLEWNRYHLSDLSIIGPTAASVNGTGSEPENSMRGSGDQSPPKSTCHIPVKNGVA